MTFDDAVQITLKNEGTFQNYANDAGNWTGGKVGKGDRKGTKYGISAASYPDLDIKSLSEDDARAIYKRDFWDRYNLDRFAPSVATKLFDTIVLMGADGAILCLQHAIRACKLAIHEDGLLGPQTVSLANQLSDPMLLPAFREAIAGAHREQVEREPTDKAFLNDWLERAYQ